MIGETDTRPWGSWQVLDEGEGFKVKRITVTPGSRLSYQTHEHRAEHWVVAAGRATCVIDGETVVADTGQCIDVPLGVPHRIGNADDTELVIIEVMRGSYLGEDDIIRLADDFGRAE
ncbi:phosphomannose isomerase type II C-terminal cupin domain [Nocardioides sp. CER19]|uniref:phosphomannose isomerase type II C-terminal cupin domain n=1 Tax=Nocardioides sp. CER19 TaxID=3038538 RepID=UPI00244C8AD0|nr:phosphomannose isomerase type II C-terminal cupin domain [Nocardioides sp. CER19]MDH2413358.1 phosphomannose isomerase type II C-terminal cupin domain [Nocardioides sp. CER19]